MGGGRVNDCHRQSDRRDDGRKRRGASRRARPIPAGLSALAPRWSMSALGLAHIGEYEQTLMRYALQALKAVPDLTLYGPDERLG